MQRGEIELAANLERHGVAHLEHRQDSVAEVPRSPAQYFCWFEYGQRGAGSGQLPRPRSGDQNAKPADQVTK